jgi:tetratricopeptide (TPR) repeat protein
LRRRNAPRPSRLSKLVGACLIAIVVSGCAHTPPIVYPADVGPGVELRTTPFFAQEIHQCGPAALATVLGASGLSVTPDELVSQTYLPGRRGSLQVELIAAARRHQRIAYLLDPDTTAVFAELDAGHPVLVLQDLGVGPLHVWHYAVVVGYESGTRRIVLRSGTTERLTMPYADFVRSWRKSNEWAVVVLAADTLPATAQPGRYVESIEPIEQLGDTAVARDAYATALRRWPEDPVALFGLATTQYRLGELTSAAATYERLLRLAPGNPIVLNNLAEVMLGLGCPARALGYADAAQSAAPHATSALTEAIADTRSKAVAARLTGRDASECSR